MLNLDKNKKYLLACSYGPDSMALFFFFLKDNINFEVAHVNYHLRKESDDEEKGLREFCKLHSIVIHAKDVTQSIRNNVEAKCREIRYSFFHDVYLKGSFDALLVAHNEDDHLETYLLQKRRKNLVKFYGIQEKTIINSMNVIRPLLSYTKQELFEYCKANNIPFALDKTNLEPIYQRNKIRLEVVSKMNRQNRDALLKEIDQNNNEIKTILSNVSSIDSFIPDILRLNDVELAYYLYKIINDNKFIHPITHKNVQEVRKILLSGKPNIYSPFYYGKYVFIKEYDRFYCRKNEEVDGYSFAMSKPGIIDNEYFYANFKDDSSNRNVYSKDYPITIRTYLDGDKYKIKDYEVLVRRLFIDWKMPKHLRKVWPIIVNKDGRIIYIPRYRKEFKPDSNCNFYVKECFTLK